MACCHSFNQLRNQNQSLFWVRDYARLSHSPFTLEQLLCCSCAWETVTAPIRATTCSTCSPTGTSKGMEFSFLISLITTYKTWLSRQPSQMPNTLWNDCLSSKCERINIYLSCLICILLSCSITSFFIQGLSFLAFFSSGENKDLRPQMMLHGAIHCHRSQR